MTIRDYLRRRTGILIKIAIFGWCLILISMLFNSYVHYALRPIGFLIFFVSVFTSLIFIKCPRCSAKITQQGINNIKKTKNNNGSNYCPSCGVSFDEEHNPDKTDNLDE